MCTENSGIILGVMCHRYCCHLFRRDDFRAIVLLATSNLEFSIAILLFFCGLVAWSLAEYIAHRFVLRAIAPVQHGIHHARPQDAVDRIFWQIWLAFAVVYLTTPGTMLAGVSGDVEN